MSSFWPPLFLFRDCAGAIRLGTPTAEDCYVSESMLYCVDHEPWLFYVERSLYTRGGVWGFEDDPVVRAVMEIMPRARAETDHYGISRLAVDDPKDMMFLKLRLG